LKRDSIWKKKKSDPIIVYRSKIGGNHKRSRKEIEKLGLERIEEIKEKEKKD